MHKEEDYYDEKRMLGVLALMLVCIFALSGCKKNVGTPEDNAVKEDSQDGEDAEEEEDTYSFGFSAIDMENPYFITLEAATREAIEKEGYRMITKIRQQIQTCRRRRSRR